MQNQGQTFAFLNDNLGRGLSALGQGISGAKDDLQTYLPASLSSLQGGYDSGVHEITTGTDRALGDVSAGIGRLDPYVQAGNAATGMYTNSLGLNGAAGNDAAEGAFRASPGYNWQVDQATEAAARKAASLGVAGSGNTLDSITRLGSNLADQEYGAWQNRLQGLGAQGQSAATSQLGGFENMGGLEAQRGSSLAALAGNLGQQQSSLYSGLGSSLAGLDAGQGSSELSAYNGLGNTVASLNMNTANAMSNNLMQAGQATDAAHNANDNLGLGLLGAALKLGTANAGGGTSLFGKLFS